MRGTVRIVARPSDRRASQVLLPPPPRTAAALRISPSKKERNPSGALARSDARPANRVRRPGFSGPNAAFLLFSSLSTFLPKGDAFHMGRPKHDWTPQHLSAKSMLIFLAKFRFSRFSCQPTRSDVTHMRGPKENRSSLAARSVRLGRSTFGRRRPQHTRTRYERARVTLTQDTRVKERIRKSEISHCRTDNHL